MNGPSSEAVPRPTKASEFGIEFGTRQAEKGWMDLIATARNAAVDAWDFLTRTPTASGDHCHRLRGDLGVAAAGGVDRERWQYKVTGGGRIWYSVIPSAKRSRSAGTVVLERVATGHPNETVKRHR